MANSSSSSKYFISHGQTQDWITATASAIVNSASYRDLNTSPLRYNDIYMKVPSARSGLAPAKCNGIKSTVQTDRWGTTDEWTFISIVPGGCVSQPGDSGSAIMDSDCKVAAMMWGGDLYAVGDLTFATPIGKVVEDIEHHKRWQKGSFRWKCHSMKMKDT